MSNFTPNTKIYLGNVPFDPSYKHVRLYNSRTEQSSELSGLCSSPLNREDYTYQRLNNTLKVPYNAERLYKYNYCMFQNSNYPYDDDGNCRWVYAFITNIEYVSETTSRLWLQTDEFQTWFLDSSIPTCYVEREHVNDDTIGAHIKDEGLSPGEMRCQKSETVYEKALYIVAAAAAEPFRDGTYTNVAGDTYYHMPSGCSLSVFGSVDDFKSWMNALADNGQQDAVSAVYMVPATIISPDHLAIKTDPDSGEINGWGYWLKSEKDVTISSKKFSLGFDSLDGYKPANNKMYCYPFEYCEVTNFMGDSQQFRLEFMEPKGTLQLDAQGGVDANAHMSYLPKNYNNIEDFWEGAINLGQFPTCQWVYQAYTNWQGQGKVSLGALGYGIDVNARTQLPYWQTYGSTMTNNIGIIEGVAQSLLSMAATKGKSAAAENTRGNILESAGVSAGSGLLQNNLNMFGDYIQIQADLGQQQRQPNTSKGATNTSVNQVNVRNYGIAVRKYTCRAEFAKMCDDYLSAYGYNVSEFKVPNLTGRAHWNYVKTIGMQLHGDIPTTAMQTIQNMFDKGVTLWHDMNIGDYGQTNSIV